MTWRQQLDRPELAPLWHKLHDRLSSGRPVSRVRLERLDDPARAALADLLGLDRLPGPQPTIALSQLDTALDEICGLSTRDVVAQLIGPIGDRAAAAQDSRTQRDALWTWAAAHETVTAQPVLTEWITHLRNSGALGTSPALAKAQLTSAITVLAALPADGSPLPVLAARLLNGDSHALDDGTRLSSIVLRALSVLYSTSMPENAQERRALWSRAGVADDELSTTVLVAGFRPLGDGPVSRITRICADTGHAASITLAQLRAPGGFGFAPGHVHIVENPSVLALALLRFRDRCPPLVCTSGWPNTASMLLLRLLAEHGAELRYHGDFDGEGIRIAAHVLARTSATTWRMSADDYRAGVARIPAPGPDPGRLTSAPWDAQLTPAMQELRTAVVEEVVTDQLLDDLNHRI